MSKPKPSSARAARTRSAFAAPSGFVAAVTRPKAAAPNGAACRKPAPEPVREAA